MKKKNPEEYITLAPDPRWREDGATAIANYKIFDKTLTDRAFRIHCRHQATPGKPGKEY